MILLQPSNGCSCYGVAGEVRGDLATEGPRPVDRTEREVSFAVFWEVESLEAQTCPWPLPCWLPIEWCLRVLRFDLCRLWKKAGSHFADEPRFAKSPPFAFGGRLMEICDVFLSFDSGCCWSFLVGLVLLTNLQILLRLRPRPRHVQSFVPSP